MGARGDGPGAQQLLASRIHVGVDHGTGRQHLEHVAGDAERPGAHAVIDGDVLHDAFGAALVDLPLPEYPAVELVLFAVGQRPSPAPAGRERRQRSRAECRGIGHIAPCSTQRSPRCDDFAAGSRRPAMLGQPAGPGVGADLAAEGTEFPGADVADNDVRGHLAADPGRPGQVGRGAPLIWQQRGQVGDGRQHAHHRSGQLHRVSADDHTRLPQLEPASRRQIQQRGAEAVAARPAGEQRDHRGRRCPARRGCRCPVRRGCRCPVRRGRRCPVRRPAGTLPQHSDHRLPAPGQRSLHLWNGRSGRTVQRCREARQIFFERLTRKVLSTPVLRTRTSGAGGPSARSRAVAYWSRPGSLPRTVFRKTGWADPLALSPMEAPRGAGIPADMAAGIPESLRWLSAWEARRMRTRGPAPTARRHGAADR